MGMNVEDCKELSIEQIMFLEKYLESFDIESAADAVDLPIAEANTTLEHPVVKGIVAKEKNFRFRRLSVTNSRTLLHIAEVAYKQPLVDTDDPYAAAEREQVLAELPLKESIKGLELLCKYSEVLKSTPGAATSGTVEEKLQTVDAAADIAKRLLGATKK